MYLKIFYLVLLSFASQGCSKDNSISEPDDKVPGAAYIDVESTAQLIRGFGGVNMPGWIPDLTHEQVYKAFGTDSGQIGLSILRIRVPYDSSLFYLEVPAAKLAHSLGVTIIASPWSPPPQLKSNNNIVGGILNDTAYDDYANHLNSFAVYMASNDAELYAVSIQNEPDVNVNYESCKWNASQILSFIKNNALSIGIRIIAPESASFNHSLSDPLLNDPAAVAKVAIIGGHIYGGGLISYPLAASKGKEVWMTEHLDLDTTWNSALATGKEIDDCMYYGMNAYIWWYIRRFYGLIDETGNITKRGYVISQYSRFIRPGYYKISATSNPQGYIFVSAYRNNSRVVIVAINSDPQETDQRFIIENGDVKTFTKYVTSSKKNCLQEGKITVEGNSFSSVLDSLSISTFVSN